MRNHFEIHGLHVLVDRLTITHVPDIIENGASVIQLRDKTASEEELIVLGNELREMTRGKALFIMNDNADIAREVKADGVHVGQKDAHAKIARDIIGPDAILGISATTVYEALQAEHAGADYVGVHTFQSRVSKPKPTAGSPGGLAGLQAIREAVSIPVIAIGGITEHNTAQVIAAGADGIAVIGGVLRDENPGEATKRFTAILNSRRVVTSAQR